MNYWLFVTTPTNWGITKKKHVLGYAERYRNLLSRTQKNDKCLVYIKGRDSHESFSDPTVIGEYEIVSDLYTDSKPLFDAKGAEKNETFPLRLKLKCLTPSAKPVAFRPLVSRLSFIKNKKYWGATFHGRVIVNISEQDYKTIVSAL
jgi:predicted RNA-binding protein